MGPFQHLTGLGLVASGCIRILAAYVLFIALTRLTLRSRVRHAFWLLFLVGAGFYWATLVAQALVPILPTHITIRSVSVAADQIASIDSDTTTIAIPFSWDHRLKFASDVLACAYASGLIIMLFRLLRRRRVLRITVARARPVSGDLCGVFERACHRLGISRCRILELPGLLSPGTAYTWKPLILLPDRLDLCFDKEELVDVLYHELIHIRRLDFFWSTLVGLVGCVLFFHPAVWLALSKLDRERELACDEAVMKLRQGRRADYALCLTRLARRRILGCQLEAPSHLGLLNSFLALRIQALLEENRRRTWGKQCAVVSANLLALLLFFAGWSSLSLAVELSRPMANIAPLMASGKYSTASRRMMARGRKPYAPHPWVKQQPSIPVTLHEARAEPEEHKSLAPADANIDALIAAPQVESRVSPREGDERSTWDEAPPSIATQSPVSWRRTVMGAAIGALERVALGGRDVDKDIDKDGGRSPANH
jgi:beta-lactamase regulating signal transducer with metallopeptidase domain